MLKNKGDKADRMLGKNAGISYAIDLLEHWKQHGKEERLECLSTILGYIFSWTWEEFGEEWTAKVAEKIHRIMAITGAPPEIQKDVASRLFGLIAFLSDFCPHEAATDKHERAKEKPHHCCLKGCQAPVAMTIQHHFGPDEPRNICTCEEHAGDPAIALRDIFPRLAKGEGPTSITVWPRRITQ